MDIKKLAPWNWFKKEEDETGSVVPVYRHDGNRSYQENPLSAPLVHLYTEMSRLFEDTFRGGNMPSFRSELFSPLTTQGLLKPHVDIGATEKEYTIAVEVPGVNEEDVKIEVSNNTMIIKGEKRQAKEEKKQDFYRIERSYGSFQRMLSLPEDADQEAIKASFKKGILKIKMVRKPGPQTTVKHIKIKEADE